jgi:hypothetical protein
LSQGSRNLKFFFWQKIEKLFFGNGIFFGKFRKSFWETSALRWAGSLNADPETFPDRRWSLIAVPLAGRPQAATMR